jgi:hypothetical protein
MRPVVLSLCLIVATLLPKSGTAQVAYRPTPFPHVTAANAIWQINGEPIFFAGSFYYPTGPTVFFDGQLMARVGEYLTVPLYADTTQEAFSRVFVPIGGAVMKPYERRRAGALSGTVGSTTPSWPVQVASNALQSWGGVGNPTGEPLTIAEERAVGTSGAVGSGFSRPPALSGTPAFNRTNAAPIAPAAIAGTAVQSVPRPTTNTGISVVFEGARWVSAGSTVAFSPDRFVPVGDYHGFPVYREKQGGGTDTIYVTVVADGPLAPYKRR